MSLPPLNKLKNIMPKAFTLNITVNVNSEREGKEIEQAIASMLKHFTAEEIKKAGEKAKNPITRSIFKKFL